MQPSARRSSDLSEGTLNSNSNDSAIELFDLSPACLDIQKQNDRCRSVSSYLSMIRKRSAQQSRSAHSLQAASLHGDVNGPKRAYSLDLGAQHRPSFTQDHALSFKVHKSLTPESSLEDFFNINGSKRQSEHTVPHAPYLDPHYRRASTLRVSAPTTAVSEHFPVDADLLRAVNSRLSRAIETIPDHKSPVTNSKQGSAEKIFEEAFSNAVVCLSSRNSPSSLKSRLDETTLTAAVERGRTLTQLHSLTRNGSRGQASRRASPSWSLLADCGSAQPKLSELCFPSSPAFVIPNDANSDAHRVAMESNSSALRPDSVSNASGELSSSSPRSDNEARASLISRTSTSYSFDSACSEEASEKIRRATASQLMTDEAVGCVLEELCDLDERPLGHARYIELDVSPSSAATANFGYGSEEAPVITLKIRTRSNTLEPFSETPKRALPPIGPPPTADLPALPASADNTKSYSISPMGRPPARSRSVTDMLSRRDSPVIGPRRRAAEERRSPPESKSAYFASTCREQKRPSSEAEQQFPRMATTPTGLPCPPRPPKNPRRPSTGADGAEMPRLLESACGNRSNTPMSVSVTQGPKPHLCSQVDVGASPAPRAYPSSHGRAHTTDVLETAEYGTYQLAREHEASTAAVHFWRDKVLAPVPPPDVTQRAQKIGRGILDRVHNLVALKTATVSQGCVFQQQTPTQQHREGWSPVSERTAMLLLRGRSFSEGEQAGQAAPTLFEARLISRAATAQSTKRNGRPATAGRCQEASERGPHLWGAEREASTAASHLAQKALSLRPSTSHGERKATGVISSTARGAVTPPRVVNTQREATDVVLNALVRPHGDTLAPPFPTTIPPTRTRSMKREKSIPQNLRSAPGRSGSMSKQSAPLSHLVQLKSSSGGGSGRSSDGIHGPSCLASSASSSWSSLSSRRLTD